MKTFKEYIDKGDMPNNLDESSLSRIMTHIQSTKQFGVMSAYRKPNTDEQNKADQKELAKEVRKKGYGYIALKGGYQEKSGFINEESLFIPNISRKEIVQLGKDYEQDSIIHKSKNDFVMIGTNKETGIGKILEKFKTDGKNISVDDVGSIFTDFFSKLVKGSHRGKKFRFISEIQTGNQFVGSRIILQDVLTGEIIKP